MGRMAQVSGIGRLLKNIASYPGHVGGEKSGLVSTVCACAKTPMISWGIVYHRLQTFTVMRNHSQTNLGIYLHLETVGKINTCTSDIFLYHQMFAS